MIPRTSALKDRVPRGLRLAFAISLVLHAAAIAALAITRSNEASFFSPPPVIGASLVSPEELAAIEGGGSKPSAPSAPVAPRPPEPKTAETPPPDPPKPVKPPEPPPNAIPIREEKPVKPPEKPKEPEKPKAPEKPLRDAKAEKPKETKPPEPKKPEKPEKLVDADKSKKPDSAKESPAKTSSAAKPSKPADVTTTRPSESDVASMEKRIQEMAERAAKAGVETGVTWGVEGGTGKVPADACQAALAQYGSEVIKKLRASVNYPDQRRGLTALIRLEIAKDGSLVSQSVGTSSGDRLFDESVIAGLKKAAPFEPLPACWQRSSFAGAIEFVAEGGSAG